MYKVVLYFRRMIKCSLNNRRDIISQGHFYIELAKCELHSTKMGVYECRKRNITGRCVSSTITDSQRGKLMSNITTIIIYVNNHWALQANGELTATGKLVTATSAGGTHMVPFLDSIWERKVISKQCRYRRKPYDWVLLLQVNDVIQHLYQYRDSNNWTLLQVYYN